MPAVLTSGVGRAAAGVLGLSSVIGATACEPEIECQATIIAGGQSHTATSKSRDKVEDVELRAIKAACKKRCQDNRVSDADKEWVGGCTTGCLADVDQNRMTLNINCTGDEPAADQ